MNKKYVDNHELERTEIRKYTGEIIKKNRIKHNISQESLAKALGITKSSISRYEAGTIEIPSSLLPIICHECHFSPMEYATAWMNIKVNEIPKENQELYTETVNMIEFLINEAIILFTNSSTEDAEIDALYRINEIYNTYLKNRRNTLGEFRL